MVTSIHRFTVAMMDSITLHHYFNGLKKQIKQEWGMQGVLDRLSQQKTA